MDDSSYSRLQAEPIRATLHRLERRIAERFPRSGLHGVAREMVRLGNVVEAEIADLQRPRWWLRSLSVLAVLGVVGAAVWAIRNSVRIAAQGVGDVADLLQGLDAASNLLVVLALTLVFLVSLEGRLKRRRALPLLHRLRSTAHVIDMHQLTKDPDYALGDVRPTASSPERDLTRAELVRYLDYCSEMLALTSKLAALHAEQLQDPVVLEAVNDIEALCSGLASKIWQKLVILSSAGDARSPEPLPRS